MGTTAPRRLQICNNGDPSRRRLWVREPTCVGRPCICQSMGILFGSSRERKGRARRHPSTPVDKKALNPFEIRAWGLSAALGCQDSNLEPSDPESDVLPIAPQPIIMRKPFFDNNLRRLSLLHNCRGSALGKLPGQTRSSESVTCTVARAIIATDRKSGLYQQSHACFIHVYKPAVNRPHDGFWARRGRPEKRGAHPQSHHGQRTSPLASTHGRATAA